MRLLIVLALVVLLVVAGIGTVDAAKGGKGKGKHAMEATLAAPTLTVSPAPPLTAWGQEYRVDGEGYEPGTVYIVASEPHPWAFWLVWPDETGHIWWVRDTGPPGTYILDAYQRNGGGVLYLQATITFEVLPTE